MATRKKGLGRGLDALLGADSGALDAVGKGMGNTPTSLPVKSLQTGRYQPRTHMDEGSLSELAESIKNQGIMQPILVRPVAKKMGKYEIIAGERRYRAAQIAGLKEVPVLVREVADENAAVMALIENIQREDLNPLEEAQGIKRLIEEFELTHEQAANAIGRSRSATTNLLRLLNLAEPVQTMLLAGDIEVGHAKVLLTADSAEQIMIANDIIARQLSVRQTEKQISQLQKKLHATPNFVRQKTSTSGDKQRLEMSLSEQLATQVQIKARPGKGGQLIISFNDWEHLDHLLQRQGLKNANSA